ncbi:MAG: hypothetical protein GJV46_16490 [Geobacter sp.]|nr:hypothetical protein [Geobacter sp.]
MGINQIEKNPTYIALVGGIATITGINNVSRLLGVWDGHGMYLVAFIAFIIFGMALAHFVAGPQKKISLIVCAYTGIVVGVITDVSLDFFLRHYDRNLFPFEIVMWWIFAPIPLLVGMLIVQQQTNTKIAIKETKKDT